MKDRIALSMIEAAEAAGDLRDGVAVVEATSGNTGIGLAMICAQRGYRLILTMPETMSFERRALVTRYGAEVVLTPGDDDMGGAVEPAASPVLSGGKSGTHAIEGIGAGFVPPILNREIIDDVITIEDRDAFDMTEALAIAVVNILGAVAMLLFPVIGTFLLMSPEIYGAWCGLAIHATPQVIAAGFAHPVDGQTAGEVATIAKLVPPFVLVFLLAALLRTSGFFPEVTFHMTDRFLFGAGDRTMNLAQVLGLMAGWLITTAIAGVGLLTEFRALRLGGGRPIALGVGCSVVAAVVAVIYVSVSM